MQKESGFAPLFLIITVLLIAFAGVGFGVYYMKNRAADSVEQKSVDIDTTTGIAEREQPSALENVSGTAPVIPNATPTIEPTASASASPIPQLQIKSDPDKCTFTFETSSFSTDAQGKPCATASPTSDLIYSIR